MSLDRLKPETFVVPKELSVEFQTFIQRLLATNQLHSVIEEWYDNLAYIFHRQQPHKSLEDREYDRVVILMTPDESQAFEAAYETACEKFDDIESVDKKFIYTALAMHTLEEYGDWRQIVD